MKNSSRVAIYVYLLLTVINVVILGVELNYGTVVQYCRQEVSKTLEMVNTELENEENLTDQDVERIKQKYGILGYGKYVIDTVSLVQDCVNEKVWFNLEF